MDAAHFMEREASIALIGCGKMGEAILAGWLASDQALAASFVPETFTVVDPGSDKRDRIVNQYGVNVVADVADLGECDMYVLAVKPQVMPDVLKAMTIPEGALVVSIAAGIPTADLEAALPGTRVVRVMPNMPLQVGMGASVVAAGKSASEGDVHVVNDLFAALGMSRIIPEDQIDAVCAISGGGPAYVAYTIEALRDAGVRLGLSSELAEQLALQTVGGTWRVMHDQRVSPEDMRASVCSPGGTTLAALAAMDVHDFKQIYDDAMQAAVRRAEELRGGAM